MTAKECDLTLGGEAWLLRLQSPLGITGSPLHEWQPTLTTCPQQVMSIRTLSLCHHPGPWVTSTSW